LRIVSIADFGFRIADLRELVTLVTVKRQLRKSEIRNPQLLQGEAQAGATARAVFVVFKAQSPSMRFRNLPAQDQSDAGTLRFGCKERNE
jgi:hypothetical protein